MIPASTALKGWRDAERLIGVPKDQLLRLPADLSTAKPEELDAVYSRLGRPAAATDYKLPKVEGGEEFAGKMATAFHQAGLSQRQIDVIAPAYNSYITEAVAAQEKAQEQREQLDLQNLHREWPGQVFDQRQEMARRAVREFVSPVAGDESKTAEMLGQIEDAIGTLMFLKLFSGIGEKVSEARYIDGDRNRGTFGMTPAAAKAELDAKMQDRVWSKKVFDNPKGPEGQEWDRLIQLASQAGRA